MSAPTGPSTKGEKGKGKYRSLDINNIYSSSRSENSESQQTKSTAPRRHGMQNLGKVPRRPPVNLPSIRSESSGNDPSISLIQHGAPGWGLKSGEGSGASPGPVDSQQPSTSTTSAAPAAAPPPAAVPAATQTSAPSAAPVATVGSSLPSGDKTWSSVMSGGSGGANGPDRGPQFLVHQSPQFQQEFPSLSGEPGAPPAHPAAHYGPGPALRPQSEGSWSRQPPPHPPQPQQPAFYDSVVPQFLMRADAGGFPSFPDSIQTTRPRSQNNTNSENRLAQSSAVLGGRVIQESDEIIPRPIVRDEDLHRMDELARDDSWAANDDIDYNEKLAFSDSESIGENEKEKENNLREKNKPLLMNKESKKEIDLDKSAKDMPPYPMERVQPPPLEQWRTPQNYTNDYRNNSRSHQPPLRVDDSEIDIKRRQVKQNKMAASEKAKQRKEEEEKRFEESRGKKSMKDDSSDFHVSINPSGMGEWEKEDRLKSSDNFKQMTQGSFKFQMEPGPPSNRERERDRDRDIRRDNQMYRYSQKVNRFGNRNNKQGQYGGSGGGFESKWTPHGPPGMGRHVHDDKDDRKDKMNEPSDRLRHNLRDDRSREDMNKRNYYDSHHAEFNSQSSFQAHNRDSDNRDKDAMNKESEKDLMEHDGKEWDTLKTDLEARTLDERLRRDVNSQNEHFSQSMDQFEERSQRPDGRDRPMRPDSRDSRASKDSRSSRDDNRTLPMNLEGEYVWQDNDYGKDKLSDKGPFKEKDSSRRDLPHRLRDHVPGPITPQKVEAHEHKHSLSQAEKKEKDIKDTEVKVPKSDEIEGNSVWHSSTEDKSLVQPLMESSKLMSDSLREDDVHDELDRNKDDSLDKKKEPLMRDRRDDKLGRGGSRGNRMSRTTGGYSQGQAPNQGGYGSSARTWNSSRDQRPRRSSPKGKSKHGQLSESDNSADEVSASTESGKEDKKIEKKMPSGTWKNDKSLKDDKMKDKLDLDKSSKGLVDKKPFVGGQGRQDGRKSDGGFAPRGEPSRRGRGGSSHQRGGSHIITGSHYGPPGNKPFTTPSSAPPLSQLHIHLQDKQFSPPQPGRKLEDSNKSEDKASGNSSSLNSRNKNRPLSKLGDMEEGWETTSETSDSSDVKKSGKVKSKTDKKSNRGTIGDKRGTLNSTHINGRPSKEDLECVDSGNEKKYSKEDSDLANAIGVPCEDNGFQEVKSKKLGRPIKEEVKRSRSKPKDKQGGVKSQQTKNFSREFVSNKPPRMQRLELSKKQQQQSDVSDMNKLNHSVSSLFPLRGNEIGCPPPPPHNAWMKPITATLRTTPPLATSTIGQMTSSTSSMPPEKVALDLVEIGQSSTSSQTSSPTQEKALSKITREVEKGLLDGGPPVNTIIFENTNFKRDSSDLNLKTRNYGIKGPRPLEKGRDRKIEDDLNDGNHSLNLVGFKPSDITPSDVKPQEGIQVPISFSKNEDSADMKLDFAFDSDLSQLSDDKTNQSAHVGQTSTADLNQKIASVKKVWDTVPGMSGHDEPHSSSSTFTPTFSNDKSLESAAPPHHSDHSEFNPPDSVYSSSGQLGSSSSGGYVVSSGAMMKGDAVTGVNTMCKGMMFQPQPVPVIASNIGSHPGPLSTPPLIGFPATQYSSSLPAVPSPPNVLFNSQPPNHQTDIYPSYQVHGSTNRSFNDFSQSYSMPQNNFQPNVFLATQSAPPGAPQSVYPNHSSQFRLTHHSSSLNQQMSNSPSPVLISSSSNSIVSASQMKSSQSAIGTKSVASAPAPNYHSQIVLIEPGMNFLPNSQFMPQRPIQHSSSFYSNPGVLTGSQGGGLFNSSLQQLGSSGVSALQSAANQFGVGGFQGGGSQPSTQNSAPPSAPLPNQLPQQQYQSQMAGSYRNQGYPKGGQLPGDCAKSPSQDQFPSMFKQGGNVSISKQVRVNAKPQPSPSPQPPQPHKFSSYPPNVSQNNLVYQQSSAVQQSSNGRTAAAMNVGGSISMVSGGPRYVTPIQRPPLGNNFHQQQQQQQIQQQMAAAAAAQRTRQLRPPQPQQAPAQQPAKQYYHHQGGMKMDSDVSKVVDSDESSKQVAEKSIKDDSNSNDQ